MAFASGLSDSSVVAGTYAITPGSDPPASKEYIYLGARVIALESTPDTQTVSQPLFSAGGGTYTTAQNVTLTCPTVGSSIMYTIGASMPTATSGTPLSCGGSITVSSSEQVNAIAWENGWATSAVVSISYTITGTVGSPVFSVPTGTYATAQNVTLTCPTAGSSLNYTFGTTMPTASSGTPLSCGGIISVSSSEQVNAIAWKTGWTTSAVVSVSYTISGTVASPVFSVPTGTYATAQNVTLTCPTTGSSINYTIGATMPTASYGTPLSCGGSIAVSSSEQVNAIAWENGWTTSATATAVYTININTLPYAGSAWSEGENAGTGAGKFTFSFYDPQSPANIEWVAVMINSSYSGAGGCIAYFWYTHDAYLMNDNGSSPTYGNWGQNGILSNSQCAIDMSGARLYSSGGYLNLDLPLVITPQFAGNKNIWLAVGNMQGLQQTPQWLQVGTNYNLYITYSYQTLWTNPAATPTSYQQRFTTAVADVYGQNAISGVGLGTGGTMSCSLFAFPSSSGGQTYFFLDSYVNGASTSQGGYAGSGTLTTPACSLDLSSAALAMYSNYAFLQITLTANSPMHNATQTLYSTLNYG
jgi:hypothetical protein